jgi:hypothetical protein
MTTASDPIGARRPAGSGQPGYGAPPPGPRPLWKVKNGEGRVFRHPTPLVLWWVWVAFAVANVVDVAVVGHGNTAVRVAAGLLLVTGVIYATTVQSRVETDAEGVTIFNPLRQHRAAWGAVDGIYLGDSVEFVCLRTEPKKTKTIYSWALYSRRRARARSQIQRDFYSTRRTTGVSVRAPAEAADLAKQQTAQLMATELGRQAVEARDRGVPPGVLRSTWSWRPVVAILVPLVLVLVVFQLH